MIIGKGAGSFKCYFRIFIMAIGAIIAINAFTSGDIPPDFSVIT